MSNLTFAYFSDGLVVQPPPKFRAMEGGELTAEHIENRIDVLTTASWHFGVGLSHQILGKFPEILAKSSFFLAVCFGLKDWGGGGNPETRQGQCFVLPKFKLRE